MGIFTKDIKTFDDLFLHLLQDIYYAENKITKKLPGMIEKATNRELAAGLRDHLEQTKDHVDRLEQVFKKLGKEPKGVDCPAIDGIIKEAEESWVKSPIRKCSMQRLSPPRKPSNTTRSRVTAR
jgi:ferritin-like metal-binding protein YciE